MILSLLITLDAIAINNPTHLFRPILAPVLFSIFLYSIKMITFPSHSNRVTFSIHRIFSLVNFPKKNFFGYFLWIISSSSFLQKAITSRTVIGELSINCKKFEQLRNLQKKIYDIKS